MNNPATASSGSTDSRYFPFSSHSFHREPNKTHQETMKRKAWHTRQELELTFLDLTEWKMTCEEKHGVQREGTERNSHVASYHPSQTNQRTQLHPLRYTPEEKLLPRQRKTKPENRFTLILTKSLRGKPAKQTGFRFNSIKP